MNISERLKEQMKIRKLSVPALSEKTGISENTIKNYLYRGQEPRAEAMLVLANALNVSTSYLLGETDDPDLPYWEDPDITADLDNIDEQLLPRFLSAYRNADAETKFYAQDVMAQLTKVLEKVDPDFQRRGAFLLKRLCEIAYDFSLDCKHSAEMPPDKRPTLLGKQFFVITLMARCLEAVHKHYLPADALDSLSATVSPDEQST